jgi:high-affinity iron transporter
MLREGLEAALIVAIVLAYLKRLGRESEFKPVWIGTGLAVVVSIVAGAIIFAAVGELEGKTEEITEGIIAVFAASVLTWMIFWMGKQARSIKGSLHSRVDAALATNSAKALTLLAFVTVVREGFESALFMLSTGVGEESNGAQLVGGFIGVAIAMGIGYLVYRGSRKVNLRVFFRVTGIFIILFAAGLLGKAVHEFQEAALFGSVNPHLWDVSSIDLLTPGASETGNFLRGLFGWSVSPSVEEVFAYFAFLVPIGGLFLFQTRKVPQAAPASARTPEPAVETAS